MIKGKEKFQNELIEKYHHWQQVEKDSFGPMQHIAHDEQRKIRVIFAKTFHKPIYNYL
jgi:hypothetical protein